MASEVDRLNSMRHCHDCEGEGPSSCERCGGTGIEPGFEANPAVGLFMIAREQDAFER